MRLKGYRKTLKRLDDMGVRWHFMLPVQPLKGRYQRPDLRNHRKILVVDGEVGFAGSQNVIDRAYHKPQQHPSRPQLAGARRARRGADRRRASTRSS